MPDGYERTAGDREEAPAPARARSRLRPDRHAPQRPAPAPPAPRRRPSALAAGTEAGCSRCWRSAWPARDLVPGRAVPAVPRLGARERHRDDPAALHRRARSATSSRSDGVVSSGFFFELRATLAGERGDMRAGTYHLQQDMTYGAALKVLTDGRRPRRRSRTSRSSRAGRAPRSTRCCSAQGVSGSYFAATRRSPLIDPRAYGAPAAHARPRGLPVPDTYQLVEPVGIPKLVTDQLKTFRQQFAHVNLGYARSKHLTPYDVLIIASMVQAEAATAHDRPLIASVIYNRLRPGMPLQIDATTRYATGNYTQAAHGLAAELALAVQHANPQGADADADRQPGARLDPGRGPPGAHQLPVLRGQGVRERRAACSTSTYKQFLADAAKYQQARERARRQSPERCSKQLGGPSPRPVSASSAGRSPTAARRRSKTRR